MLAAVLAAQPPASQLAAPPGSQPAPGAAAPGAQAPGQRPVAKRPSPPPPPKADPEAVKLFDQAVAKCDLKQIHWLETTYWSRIHLQGLLFEATGRYVVGPDYRLHLDLAVDLGDARGRLQMFGDGQTIWEVLRAGPKQEIAAQKKVSLGKILAALKAPHADEIRADYIDNQLLAGVAPMLKALQSRVVFTKLDKDAAVNGHKAFKLTGAWSPKVQAPPEHTANVPDRCEVFLDQKTLWPERIEWWGDAPPQKGRVLLLEIEFRSPHFGEQPKGEQFAYKPDKGAPKDDKNVDQTDNQLDIIKHMVEQGRRSGGDR